jgi:RNA polymerase sigma-70 factor (ECF subfamily)
MRADSAENWNEVLLAAGAGDSVAARRFFAWARTEIEPLCRHLGDGDSIDDLVQETCERIVRSMHRYRGDGPAVHWVRQIARRVCADAARRRQRIRRRDRRLNETTVIESDLDHGTTELDDVLDGLDPDRRDAFVLTQILGLSYAEASEVLDCPIGTIRSRVARARLDLIDHLEAAGWSAKERSA